MKKIAHFILIGLTLTFSPVLLFGQVSTLSENFDVACATTPGTLSTWFVYNPASTNYGSSDGRWNCDPLHGRKNDAGTLTPGMTCTGVWGSAFHLDTSVLITPFLDLKSYTHAYLHFDTRADTILSGLEMSVLISRDSMFPYSFDNYFDTTNVMNPPFSISDTGNWITHEIDLSYWCGPSKPPVYFAFQYTSSATTGSFWRIDNVNISLNRLDVANIDKRNIPLTILGSSTDNEIKIAFGNKMAGDIQLGICDMLGRTVYQEKITTWENDGTHIISGLGLTPGMYIVKAIGENAFGTTKVLIQ